MKTTMSLLVLLAFAYFEEVLGCSIPLEEMTRRFDLVLIGLEQNHFTRDGGEIDSQFQVFCVLKGDGGIVHENVSILATQTKYPCTKDTTPTRIGQDYIVGVSRLNDRNFTWSSEAKEETVAFPATQTNIKSLIRYCEFQNPQDPFGKPLVKSRTPCPYVNQQAKRDCLNSSDFVHTNMFLVTLTLLLPLTAYVH